MESILKYQELDGKLVQLERKLASSNEKTVMNQMIAFVKDAQNKSIELENQAKKMTEEYVALKKEYDKNIKLIKDLTSKESSELTVEEMDEIFNQINLVSSNLFMIERNLNIQLVNTKNILKEFENTKNGVIKARAKHKESKEKYEALVAQINPQIEAIKKDIPIMIYESGTNKCIDGYLYGVLKRLGAKSVKNLDISLGNEGQVNGAYITFFNVKREITPNVSQNP